MKHIKVISVLTIILIMFSGFWSGKDRYQQKEERLIHSIKTMQLLYKHMPQTRRMVANAYGFATFSNVGVNFAAISGEGGEGLAHNNRTGKNTYMNMASGGIGFGMGIKEFHSVFLFSNRKAYENFVHHGWEGNAGADAAVKLDNQGEALNVALTVAPGVKLYKLTQSGLALQATIHGTKYWKDGDLN